MMKNGLFKGDMRSEKLLGNTKPLPILILFMLVMILIPSAVAVELNPFAEISIVEREVTQDMSSFIKEDFNPNYGVIRISDTFFWFEIDRIAEYSLTSNTEKCFENCEAGGKATLYVDGTLFEDLSFIDAKTGRETAIKDSQFYLSVTEDYVERTPVYARDCIQDGKYDFSQSCVPYVVSYNERNATHTIWKEYNGEVLPVGDYKWKLTGTKDKKQSVDWIARSNGVDLKEWADWTTDDCFEGGNVTIDGDYCVNTFTINGTLVATKDVEVEVLLVAGGGGGGDIVGGGGGAGGYVHNTSYLISGVNHSVIVGYGGNGIAQPTLPLNGSNSTFGVLTAYGGGAGGQWAGGTGQNGGSGGGGAGNNGAAGAGGTGTAGQGNNGGAGIDNNAPYAAGGGGGINGTGTAGAPNVGGAGGGGRMNDINGTVVCYAGGGGGGATTFGGTATCGGGAGGDNGGSGRGDDGVNGTGGGGGGTRDTAPPGNGGSGIVIVRYLVIGYRMNATQSYPVNGYNSSSSIINLGCNFTGLNSNNVSYVNLTIINATSGAFEYGNTTDNDDVPSYNATWTTTALADGNHNWSCRGFGVLGTNGTSENRTFTIDATSPAIDLFYPTARINYHKYLNNLSLNWSVSDANLQTCLFSYNNANTTVTCAANNYSFIPTYTPSNITFYANDTYGNLNSDFTSWDYDIWEWNRSFNTNAEELTTQDFGINISYDSSYYTSLSATFRYNNTNYAPTQSGVGDNLLFNMSVTIPAVAANTIKNFTWMFILGNATSSYYINATQGNQTITNIAVDDCSSYTNIILNYTMYDEENRSILYHPINNNTINIHVLIGNALLTDYINISFQKQNYTNALVCSQNPLNSTYRMDATAQYSSTDRVVEYYYIQNYSLNKNTADINISLFDLKTVDSQEFLITYKDANYVPVENVLIEIQREYVPAGTFLIVEVPKTDKDGRTIGHFVLSDAVYTIYVRQYGRLLATYSNVRAYCTNVATGDCKINLFAEGTSIRPNSFLNGLGVSYAPYYNQSSRTYRLVYSVLDGTAKTVALNITDYTPALNVSICYSTLTAASGTLTCTIAESYGNGTAIAKVTVDGELLMTDIFKIEGQFKTEYAKYFLAFLIVITLPFLAVSSGAMMMLLVIVGLILVGMMQLIDTGGVIGISSAILWFIIAAGVILWKISSGRNT